MEEVWKEYWPGYYEVSTLGRVRSMDRYVNSSTAGRVSLRRGKLLAIREDRYGYLRVTLRADGCDTTIAVHRMVAETFVDGYKEGYEVNHIGLDEAGRVSKKDNRVESLEWTSKSGNHLHAHANSLKASGSSHVNSKLTESAVAEIKSMFAKGLGNVEIADKFKVHRGTIDNIRSGKTWVHVK